MGKNKVCSKCHVEKRIDKDFYCCKGTYRSECKKCTIKRNVIHQRKIVAWKHRYVDDDTRRSYMREYYDKNKERFAKYRSEFRERNPDYYKNYFRKRKEK